MIWKASIVLSLAFYVLSASIGDKRYAVSEQKVIFRYPVKDGDLKHTGLQKQENHGEYAKAYPSYEFSYKVVDPDTHDNKAQHEERDGNKVTGNYWLIQPDGEKRYIKYHVDDKSGFNAVINYTSPHSSVYYKRNKHHEEAGNIESGKEEDKGNESLENARQEGEDNKKVDEGKEDQINEDLRKESENEKVTDDTGNSNNEESDRQDDDGREESDERQQLGGPQAIQGGESDDGQEVGQGGNQESDLEGEKGGDGNDALREESVDVGPGADDNINQNQGVGDEREESQNNEEANVNNNEGNQENSNEPKKEDKNSVQDLWARFPSFTIIHDYPKENIKPVWEYKDDPEFYVWQGVQSWKGNHNKGGCQDSEIKNIKEHNGKKNSEEVESKAAEEKRDKENVQNKEEQTSKDKMLDNIQDKTGDETQKVKEVKQEIVSKGDDGIRIAMSDQIINEGERFSQRRRGREGRRGERRSGGQERQEGIESRETKRHLGGENRARDYRRGRSSHQLKFTPIPYGQRY